MRLLTTPVDVTWELEKWCHHHRHPRRRRNLELTSNWDHREQQFAPVFCSQTLLSLDSLEIRVDNFTRTCQFFVSGMTSWPQFNTGLVQYLYPGHEFDGLVGLDQRYEQEIDRSTIVVVCQPTPLPKLGRSCVRLWGYFLIIPHGQPKLGISWRVVGWIFLILPQIDSQSSNWVYWIKEGSSRLQQSSPYSYLWVRPSVRAYQRSGSGQRSDILIWPEVLLCRRTKIYLRFNTVPNMIWVSILYIKFQILSV